MDEIAEEALQVAFRAADAARAIILRHYAAGFAIETKADSSPVTEADRAAEAAIRDVILAAFPEHRVVGEELGSTGEGQYQWAVDPIDGTISFVHHVPLFATLIALRCEGQEVVGVIDLPALGRRFHAIAGGGAWEGSRRLQVGDAFDPASSLVCRGNRLQFERTGRMDLYERLDRELPLLRSYTDAFGHVLVACGAGALMVDPDLSLWDLAAPELLVSEAGGEVVELPEPRLPGKTTVIAGCVEAIKWVEHRL